MNVMQGSLVILDLGTPNVKYMWKGSELQGVVKVFVYRGTSLTITVKDKSVVPVEELRACGIKVKELR